MRSLPSLPPRLDPLVAAIKRIAAADPFLMSAAIAYNAIFALVPLAFAAVAAISMIGGDPDGLQSVEQTLATKFPADVSEFFDPILGGCTRGGRRHGSARPGGVPPRRALVGLSGHLRHAEVAPDDRRRRRDSPLPGHPRPRHALHPRWRYCSCPELLRRHRRKLAHHGARSISGSTLVLRRGSALAQSWRGSWWSSMRSTGGGLPTPIRMSLLSAVVAAAILALTTWLAAILIPTFGGSTLAAFGSVGVILVWSYALGLIIISVPALVPSIVDVVRGRTP